MTELFLEYKDEQGHDTRRQVTGELCLVGRHSESDICIPDGRLSRRHMKIDRFGDVYVVSDNGSSNGTILNGQLLKDPIASRAVSTKTDTRSQATGNRSIGKAMYRTSAS